MKEYRIVERSNSQLLRESLIKNGQILLPIIDVVEGSQMVFDVLGRASIESVLQLSAQGVAREKQPSRAKEFIL